jgi:hypothetical protein
MDKTSENPRLQNRMSLHQATRQEKKTQKSDQQIKLVR